jgi:hypothetical protein
MISIKNATMNMHGFDSSGIGEQARGFINLLNSTTKHYAGQQFV